MAAAWFHCLGDVPGLDYSPPVAVDRVALPRHDATPENRDDLPISGYLSWGTVWEPIPPEERDDDEDARRLSAPSSSASAPLRRRSAVACRHSTVQPASRRPASPRRFHARVFASIVIAHPRM